MRNASLGFRRRPGRWRTPRSLVAAACLAAALATAPFALGAGLQPDPSSGPVSTGLQPDAFQGAAPAAAPAAPSATAPPTRNTDAVAPKTEGPLATAATPPLAPAPHVTPHVAPAPHVTPRVMPTHLSEVPVSPPVKTTPLALPEPKQVPHRTAATHARRHAVPAPIRYRAGARLDLPLATGSFPFRGVLRAAAPHPPPAPGSRDLVPAALALLGLVATSFCFLLAAARARRDDPGA